MYMDSTTYPSYSEDILPASTLKRFLNFALDGLLFSLVAMSVLLILRNFGQINESSKLLIFFVVRSGIYVGLYFIFEMIFQKTPAKFLTKTIVISHDGSKPTPLQILIRSCYRVMPLEQISVLFSGEIGKNFWWHDSWSKTIVVNDNNSRKDNIQYFKLTSKQIILAILSLVLPFIIFWIQGMRLLF